MRKLKRPNNTGGPLRQNASSNEADTRQQDLGIQLQRLLGNQALQRLSRSQLKVSDPAGPLEQEAERTGQGETGSKVALSSMFSRRSNAVRLHTGSSAAAVARSLNARAFTIGQDMVFGEGQYAPHTTAGRGLLAHEMMHVAQQSQGATGIQRAAAEQEDPQRFRKVHERLFVQAPGGGTPTPWQNATASDRGSAGVIIDQFKAALRALIAEQPMSTGGEVVTRTTESEAETDAIAADQRIRARFPQISTPVSESQIRSAVGIISEAQTSEDPFLRQWLSNRLNLWTDIENFDITENDARYQQMLADLLADSYAGPKIRILASRTGAFTEGEGGSRKVFLHRGIDEERRMTTLLHELVHFYVHPGFKDWAAESNGPRFYEEGFTEYLARLVMTPEQATRSSYNDQWQAVNDQVALHVSEDDIAAAYFLGEVWRLESQSEVSRRLFQSQVGIRAGASRKQEAAQSRTGPGIVQIVEPGAHYRFMNLGNDLSQVKPEHRAAFEQIYQRSIATDPTARLRFVGHASSPGSEAHNLALSRRRSACFYQMAREVGVPDSQLIDANNPPHEGEARPTAENEDVHGRAFNRRVELFISQEAAETETER